MTNIVILDTGYNTSDRDGTPNTGSLQSDLSTYRVNGGSAINLRCKGIRLQGGANLVDDPNPSSADATKLHFTIFNNDVYDIDFIIDVTNSSQRDVLFHLSLIYKTTGIKLLYADTTSDTLKTIMEIIGRTDTKFNGNEVSSSIPVIVGKVRGISFNQDPSSKKFQVTGKFTFEEEKVIKK